jgi:UrcA family protein
MTNFHRATLVAALLFGCAPSIAAARDNGRVAVTGHVSTAGLNLAKASDVATFQARARRAARNACGTANTLAQYSDVTRCRREMAADTAVVLARLQARDGVQVAMVAPAQP